MKKLAVVMMVAFSITLAVMVGVRMSEEAIAVVLGMVCGVVAGIPTSLLVAAVTNRRSGKRGSSDWGRDYPPVVVVQPGQTGPSYPQSPYALSMPSSHGTRQFRMVGEENREITTATNF